jgi:hypothetical protein
MLMPVMCVFDGTFFSDNLHDNSLRQGDEAEEISSDKQEHEYLEGLSDVHFIYYQKYMQQRLFRNTEGARRVLSCHKKRQGSRGTDLRRKD